MTENLKAEMGQAATQSTSEAVPAVMARRAEEIEEIYVDSEDDSDRWRSLSSRGRSDSEVTHTFPQKGRGKGWREQRQTEYCESTTPGAYHWISEKARGKRSQSC